MRPGSSGEVRAVRSWRILTPAASSGARRPAARRRDRRHAEGDAWRAEGGRTCFPCVEQLSWVAPGTS
ncbi:MAG: hypothetical protein ABSG56_06995 [Bryobacteraceae bacterium]|jgi:hypothetical protein